MDLILWRHAQAEDPRPGIDDMDRALTPKGIKQAKGMALWLRTRLPHNTSIVVSPALRTIQTADALGAPYDIEEKIAPEKPVSSLQQIIESFSTQNKAVLLVGHQPSLGHLANVIIQGTVSDWPIKKGAIVWLSIDKAQKPVIKAVLSPELA